MKRKRWMGVLAAAVLAAAGLCWWAAGRGDPQPLLPEREDLPQEVTVTRFDPFVDHTEEKVLTDPAAIGRAVEALSTGRCDQGRRSPEDLGGGTSLDIVLTYGDGSRWTPFWWGRATVPGSTPLSGSRWRRDISASWSARRWKKTRS